MLPDGLVRKLPDMPHWRWVLYVGEDHEDMCPELRQVKRHAEEEDINLHIEVDQDDEDFQTAQDIRKWPPVEQTVRRLLIEKCNMTDISDIVYHKFKQNVSRDAVKYYRDFFFDVYTLGNYRVAEYYKNEGDLSQFPHDPPPVPGEWRDQYVKHQEGGIAELNPDEVLQQLFSDSVFRSKELEEFGHYGDSQKIKYMKLALDLYKTMQDQESSGDDFTMPTEIKAKIEYPDKTAANIYDIDDFDSIEDPNIETIEEEDDE